MTANITKVPEDIKQAKNKKYAWPGGYPLFLMCSDGGCLCVKCGKSEYRQIAYSIRHDRQDGWKVEAADVNWEDGNLYCDHCEDVIECAYPSEQEDTIEE